MSFINRFSAIDKAMVTATGNSLVVCGSTQALNVNTSDLATPLGTATRDWAACGSSCTLSMPDKSLVLFAELVWYSTVKSFHAAAIDCRTIQNQAVTFATPLGEVSITPSSTQSYTQPSGSINHFRSANVTAMVQTSQSGIYTLSKVPISVPPTGLSDTAAGWSLTVIYRDNSLSPKKIDYSSGIQAVNSSTPYQKAIIGFEALVPQQGATGYLLIGAANGGPLTAAKTLKAGSSFAKLLPLGNIKGSGSPNPGTAPNNPYNNMFTGLVNLCNPADTNFGLINVNGTNGSLNHDGFVPSQLSGARNKWDLAGIPLGTSLGDTQNQLAVQLESAETGSDIQLVSMASMVNVTAPNIDTVFSIFNSDGVSLHEVELGEKLIYSVVVKNNGNSTAHDVTLSCTLDGGCSYLPNSFKLNGASVAQVDIAAGVNIGTIAPSGVQNIIFAVTVNAMPVSSQVNAYIDYSYRFYSGEGSPEYTTLARAQAEAVHVLEGKLTAVKSCTQSSIGVNGSLNYTTVITNTGTATATGIFFQDRIIGSCTLQAGSVKVDGVSHAGYDTSTGFSLPNLTAGQSCEVKFSVTVDAVPMSFEAGGRSAVTYQYLYAATLVPKTISIYSNYVGIRITHAEIIAVRCTDSSYPQVGDIVTYTLSLTNTGNIPSSEIAVHEPLPAGTVYVSGSVYVNGILRTDYNPFLGFVVDAIAPQKTTTVTYSVTVASISSNEVIENIANIPFNYQLSSQNPIIESVINSNKAVTRTKHVQMGGQTIVDAGYAVVGDTLHYQVSITNSGNLSAFNTIFLSSITSGTALSPGSVTVNGLPVAEVNPSTGFTVGTVCPGDTVIVAYKVIVITVPSPNVIYNSSNLIFDYLPDPLGTHITETIITNTVKTEVNRSSLQVDKTVDRAYAATDETLVYTTTLTNSGTVPLLNIFFIDYMVQSLAFKKGSVVVAGQSQDSYDPTIGFYLGEIAPQSSVAVSFLASVTALPVTGYVQNKSSIAYTSHLSPESPVLRTTQSSNDVVTLIQRGDLTVTEKVSAAYAKQGDTLTYLVSISNTGNISSDILNFVSASAVGSAFVAGSVSINGQPMPLYDPTTGFSLGSINPGQVGLVQFRSTVTSVPTPNVITNSTDVTFSYQHMPDGTIITKNTSSNVVSTVINKADATITKIVDKANATTGDLLHYTVHVQNTGTVAMQAVSFTDQLPQGTQLTTGSIYLNGASRPALNLTSALLLEDIQAGETLTIQFTATVTATAPTTLLNSAGIDYRYSLSPTAVPISVSKASNTVTTAVKTLAVTNTLTVSKQYAGIGDTVTYTSVVHTTGNIAISGAQFTDILPPQMQFVAGSVTLGGQAQPTLNPITGITLGEILPGASVQVVFVATVTDAPASAVVYNKTNVYYQYTVDSSAPQLSGNQPSNTVATQLNKGALTVTAEANRSFAIVSDIVHYTFVLSNAGNTTLRNISLRDILQADSMLQPNTVLVNGILVSNADPALGITVGSLNAGRTTKVELEVQVKAIPTDGQLRNKVTAAFTYNIDPGAPAISSTAESNTTAITIDSTIVSLAMQTDKTIAKENDTLVYTVKVSNASSVSAQSITFRDILDSSLSFVANSVTINNAAQTGYDPNAGFLLPNIAAGSNTTVKFTVTIISTPADHIIYNYASVNYSYEAQSGQPVVTASTSSNTVQTLVAIGLLRVQKEVNAVYATLNDVIVYAIRITNAGTVNATAISFTDTLPAAAVFVSSSVVVNGTAQPSYSPSNAFSLTDLLPGQSHLVVFQVRVASVPSVGKISNKSDIGFSYRLLSTTPVVTGTVSSNTVVTDIRIGTLSVSKTVDKAFVAVDDNLLYTITLANSGNSACSNVRLTDIVSSDALFRLGSVSVNGAVQSGYNPSIGFSLPDIDAGGSAIVQFGTVVKNLPASSLLVNTAATDYRFFVDPAQTPFRMNAVSPIVQTTVNRGSLSLINLVSKEYATLGDVLRYTVFLTNTGTVPNTAINFRDIIQTGGEFVAGSVTIDAVPMSELDPYESFSLGTLTPGETVIVSFSVRLIAIPLLSTLLNTATAIYTYFIDPNGTSSVAEASSNTAVTTVHQPVLTITKSVDKAYAKGGESLLYTVRLLNSGNVDLVGLTLTDILQADISLEAGSVLVDGVAQGSADLSAGLVLGTLAPLASKEVKFRVSIAAAPSQERVNNYSIGTYSYRIAPIGESYTKSSQSNTVSTEIRKYGIAIDGLVDLAYATIGDTINYTLVVKNNGNSIVYALQLANVISDGARFVPSSVSINDYSYPTYDPVAGFALDSMPNGATATIRFAAKVITLPPSGVVSSQGSVTGYYKVDPNGTGAQLTALSNSVQTIVNVAGLTHVATVSKTYAQVGDVITYTSVISNTGNIAIADMWYYDALPTGVSFVNGSIRINGTTNASLTLINGFVLGSLLPTQSVSVDFQAKISTLPASPTVVNIAQTIFSFNIDPEGPVITKTIFSNPVPTHVVQSVLRIVSSVNQAIATIGDLLTYVIQITNLGNTIANSAMVYNVLSVGAQYLPGSVVLNGQSKPLLDPAVGIAVSDIAIGGSVTLLFKATVLSIPVSGFITQQASVNYTYLLDPKQPPIPYTSHSNTTATGVAKGELLVVKTVDKQYATVGDTLSYVVTVTNTGNIDATNIMFIDPIPQNVIFVIATIKINGVSQPGYNPEAGFKLNTMKPGEVVTVEYQVEVSS